MEYIVQNSMEANRNRWNILEATVSYKAWARLTPTLTHVVTYELVTSGAEDDVMSLAAGFGVVFDVETDKVLGEFPVEDEVEEVEAGDERRWEIDVASHGQVHVIF